MSAPVGTYIDGDIPYDTQVVNIGGTGGTGGTNFILEDFTPMEGSTTDVSNQEHGVPRAARDRRTLITGSGTLQFPSGATLASTPALFAEIVIKHRGADKTWIITEVGTPLKAGAETKCSFKAREKLNA